MSDGLGFQLHGHPVHRIQRIIQKVRINLRLQRLEFSILFLNCHFIYFIQQMVDSLHHEMKAVV
ncbi:hypothetical protein D3C87_1858310 [compost metagenome]